MVKNQCCFGEETQLLFTTSLLTVTLAWLIALRVGKGLGLYYVDSEGGRLKGTRFSVGFGSPYAYVYYVGLDGWKKLFGDDVGELHYHYNPVMRSTVEHEMVEERYLKWLGCYS
ncbi:proteasome subunit beta type-5 [Quercus suber]|uniref:Proteasome subunit beta type-5 n=1 Tax=Quercus suber TaxID=58331 RepID=A0AAW0L055_QUESU